MINSHTHEVANFIQALSKDELSEALAIVAREQAEKNFFDMMENKDSFFRCSVYRDLCEAYGLEWYNTPMDKGLQPFQSVDISDMTFRVKEIITNSVLRHIAQYPRKAQ